MSRLLLVVLLTLLVLWLLWPLYKRLPTLTIHWDRLFSREGVRYLLPYLLRIVKLLFLRR